ncbi:MULTISPECIES: MFS transporter [unclassified Roseitalea]|uniref:MFS transporter n=1 Tax=unclassified Roseitalea TaxID=2639107 RepID=UPI00273F307D|nr:MULTISPECIES: MFS transporter [unclassified Roseitalea]
MPRYTGAMQSRLATPVVLVLALWLAGLGAAGQFAKMAVVFTELQAFYGRSAVASGFLVSLISFVGLVLGLVAGLLAVRVGLRRLLLIGLFLGAAISFVQALLPPFWLMMASRFAEGLAHLAIVVATPTLIAQIAPKPHQGAALTLWGTFFGVAFAAVALLAPPVVAAFGLGGLFAAHGAWMLGFGALLAVILPTPPTAALDAPSLSWRRMLERHRAVYTSPFIGASPLAWVFYTLTFVALLAVLPGLVDPARRIFAATWMPLASIIASMTLGVVLLRHVPAVTVVVIGFASATIPAAAMAVLGPSAWLGIALFACLGLVQGASFAAVPQLNPTDADRALANGGLAQMGNVGNTAGTPVLAAIVAMTGFAGVPAFLIACYGAAIAIHLALGAARARAAPGAIR